MNDFYNALFNTNSKSTYRQILGYNNQILRQTPLTGGSLPAVVFLDWSYSIHRLYPQNKWLLVLEHIKNSKQVKQFIIEQSEKERRKRRTMNTLDIGAENADDIDEMQQYEHKKQSNTMCCFVF